MQPPPYATTLIHNYLAQFLFVLRSPEAELTPNHWEFPGGSIEPNETPLQAAIRENQEEVSSSPDNITYLGYTFTKTQVHVAWGSINQSEINQYRINDPELSQLKWMTLAEALTQQLTPGIPMYLKQYQPILTQHAQNHTTPSAQELQLQLE